MNRRIGLFGALFLVWISYSGFFAAFFLLSGIISSLLIVWLAERMDLLPKQSAIRYIRPRALLYYIWLLKEIVLSAKDVSLRVWGGAKNISPTMGWVKTTQKGENAKTVYANSITLTPGTVTTAVLPNAMQVHALSKEGFESVAAGGMDRKVTEAMESK